MKILIEEDETLLADSLKLRPGPFHCGKYHKRAPGQNLDRKQQRHQFLFVQLNLLR